MTDPTLEAGLLALTQPEVELAGYRLVDLEVLGGGGRLTLRFSLLRPGGESVSVEDCATASRAIARVLEADGEQLLRGRYVIEVSSPGVFRPLRKPPHFQQVIGQTVKLFVECDGVPRQLRGELVAADAEAIELRGETGVERFTYAQVRKAHLDPQLDFRRNKVA
jgi:ribosome maturation factor RimP